MVLFVKRRIMKPDLEAATPMMRQYYSIKREYPQEILFFRLGDFYEMFEEDAKTASAVLNVTLTSRHGIPMCGIPHHATKSYIKKLLDAGKRVALCEQIELPEKGIAKREVIQVISPGTVIEDDLLSSGRNNYILSCGMLGKMVTASWIDVSTGEFYLSSAPADNPLQHLRRLLYELDPSEVLMQESLYHDHPEVKRLFSSSSAMTTTFPDWSFDIQQSYKDCLELFGMKSLHAFGITDDEPGLYSVGVLISYLKDSAKIGLGHIRSIRHHLRTDFLMMDESTQKNLELLRNLQDGSERDTLFSVLRHTVTASGARMLREWIIHPLKDREKRTERLDAVDILYHQPGVMNTLRKLLKGMLDIPRITTRIFIGRVQPKDLYSLRQSLETSLEVHAETRDVLPIQLEQHTCEVISGTASLIESSIYYEPAVTQDYLIRPGYHEKLDSMRGYLDHSREYIREYEEKLKQDTGIQKLRIRYNKILGHFIEVSKQHSSKVEHLLIRKQTLVNSERYTSEYLLDLETRLQEAREHYLELEREVFEEITLRVRSAAEEILKAAHFIAVTDCYQSLAYSAATLGYVRPQFSEENILTIEKGRHPVVEQSLPPGSFVPNDLTVPGDYHRFALITGPNMAGKSTYLRQNALIIVMAYMGSFVPAQKALIGEVDKIFCRVGASDNLARGESTFLVEMHETAYILRNATEHSLIIMDEVGRGTSTTDGISIASAVLQYVLHLRSKTLFATHFHELTSIDSPLVQKLFLDVHEEGDQVVFLNRVKQGSMQSSYGIHVAKLAGLPPSVIRKAEQVLQRLEAKTEMKHHEGQPDLFSDDTTDLAAEVSADPVILEAAEQILAFDIQKSTPLEALVFLSRIQSILAKR